MGCCLSIFQKSNYDIVLKIPDSENYLHYDKNKFIMKNNINDWLTNIYSTQNFTQYVVYNDEHDDKVNGSCGHCKGIITWNKSKISWLVHSVPKFPEMFDGKNISKLPISGLEHGQSFVFVDNISIELLEMVLSNLYAMHPAIYITNIKIPFQFKKYKENHELFPPIKLSKNISHIAKTSFHNLDIYQHLAIYYEGKWICRKWIRGHECEEKNKIKNNKIISHDKILYKSTKDHSKYACNKKYVIIGDLNRMTTQFDRGGGGIIIKNKKLASEINKLFHT